MELRLSDAPMKFDQEDQAQLRRDIAAFARSVATGNGTIGTIPKWSDRGLLLDSILAESAGVLSVTGALAVSTAFTASTVVATDGQFTGILRSGPFGDAIQLHLGLTLTAASAFCRGLNVGPTLNAAANNDILTGLFIGASYNINGKTGVGCTGLNITGVSGGASNYAIVTNGGAHNFAGDCNIVGLLTISSTQVLTTRRTGWGTPTTTANRGAFGDAAVLATVVQVLGTLILDLRAHGVIGN